MVQYMGIKKDWENIYSEVQIHSKLNFLNSEEKDGRKELWSEGFNIT